MNYIRSVGGELLLEEILDCRQVEVDSECSERVKSIPRLVRVLVEEIEELGDGRMEKE